MPDAHSTPRMMVSLPPPFSDPLIGSRTAGVVSAAAVAGVAVLVARAALPRRPGVMREVLLPAARDGYAYLVVAMLTRFTIQDHRSRLQILALLGAVTVIEVVRLRPGTAPVRSATWLAGSAAVCLGVLMAKWALEPGALSDAWDRLRFGAAF